MDLIEKAVEKLDPSEDEVGKRAPKRHTAEFKDMAVQRITEQGQSVEDVARQLGIAPATLRRWRRKAEKLATPDVTSGTSPAYPAVPNRTSALVGTVHDSDASTP